MDSSERRNIILKNYQDNTNRKDATIHFTDIHKEGVEKTLSVEIGI